MPLPEPQTAAEARQRGGAPTYGELRDRLRAAEGELAKKGPRVPVTETPEFAAAVQAVKAEVTAEFGKLLAQVKESVGHPQADDSMTQMRELALAIAEITDQNEGRPKRVSPAEMARRAGARAKMEALIAEEQAKAIAFRKARKEETGKDTNEVHEGAPLYLALGKQFIGDTLHEPFAVDPVSKRPMPVTFNFLGIPNEPMRPMNDAAKAIFKEFMISIGGSTEIVAPRHQAWISAGGMVVSSAFGVPVSMATHRTPDAEDVGLDVFGPGQFDPRRDRIQVLGSIAEPARHVSTEPGGPRG